MLDEYTALIKNNTWILVPRPPDANIVRSMWLLHNNMRYPHRYKLILNCNGSTQLAGIDVDETFSPVVKPATIQTVLSLAISRHCPVHQLGVKNAFLHGSLSETVYMHQPPGFRDPQHPDHVCLLQRSLYGLKQAPSGLVCLFMHDPREPHLSALKRIDTVMWHAPCPMDYSFIPLRRLSDTNLIKWETKPIKIGEYIESTSLSSKYASKPNILLKPKPLLTLTPEDNRGRESHDWHHPWDPTLRTLPKSRMTKQGNFTQRTPSGRRSRAKPSRLDRSLNQTSGSANAPHDLVSQNGTALGTTRQPPQSQHGRSYRCYYTTPPQTVPGMNTTVSPTTYPSKQGSRVKTDNLTLEGVATELAPSDFVSHN
ncbi:ribonuclease H-like domain-containing protein [Tanacetum coccineum]